MTHFPSRPGETPIDDISELKIKWIATRGELDRYEAENIRKAVLKYLLKKPSKRSARFDFSWSLKLHKEMFGQVWRWAGKLRTTITNIGVPPTQVEQRLYDLLASIEHWEGGGMSLLEQATTLHHTAVFIHPFKNGNGRWSRMLANIWLKIHDHPLTLWPEDSVGAEGLVRSAYLEAVRCADNGDMGPLLSLHRRYTETLDS